MFSKFAEEARKVLIEAKREMFELKHPYVGSEHLLLAILKDKDSCISKKLKEQGVEYKNFKKEIISVIGIGQNVSEWFLYTPLLKKVIENAIIEAKEQNIDVTSTLLFSSLVQEGEGIAIRIMLSMGVDFDSIIEEFNSKSFSKKGKTKKKLLIDEYGYDLTKKAAHGEIDPVVGREEELDRIIEIICRRTKNNPLLIGDAGVGKTAIIEELSRRIEMGNIPTKLKGKRIISLSMASLVAGTKYRGEFEERVNKIMKELENDNRVIIFIDEIHTLVGAGGAEGAIDASNILKPILARGKIKIIGATTTEEYKKYIENDKALARRFQIINIEEPTLEKTKEILLKLRPIYESFHNVRISDEIINAIAEYSDKYIYNRKQPDKSIDILDEVSSKTSIMKKKDSEKLSKLQNELEEIMMDKNKAIIKQDFNLAGTLRRKEYEIETKLNKLHYQKNSKSTHREVALNTVAEVIMTKTKIPVFEVETNKINKISKIHENLLNNVIGQENAVNRVYQVIRKIKLGLKNNNRPISFLFVGPTGVGKTLLAKEFSKNFVGEKNLITLDMSEYKEEHSISKIVGAPPGYIGYDSKKTVLEEIKNKPYSVILVDEVEKAHPSVINLFLQILDEGKIKDSNGNIVRFDNTVIIMTSNVGFGKKAIGFNNSNEETVATKLKEFLSPEIMNRIDEVIIFNKLSKENIRQIAIKKLKNVKNKFKDKGIKISISNKVIDDIISDSNYDEYGARKINKLININLDNLIIDELLKGLKKISIETIH